jgi:hypothetical protein
MANYVVVDNDGRYDIVTSTKSSGPQQHEIVNGALNGVSFLGYSGSVNGTTTFYLVDNGPTLGRGISAT